MHNSRESSKAAGREQQDLTASVRSDLDYHRSAVRWLFVRQPESLQQLSTDTQY